MIPPILHRIAIGPIPAASERWWAKFKVLHPTWNMVTHTSTPASFPITSPYWEKCVKPAQQSDLMRYEILLRVGGVYVDWDVEPYQSFNPFLGLKGFVACEAPDRAGSAVMGFEPGHPAVEEMLKIAMAEVQGTKPSCMKGGPLAVTKACFGRDDVLILPAGTFYQMDWHERDHATDGMYARPWVYAVHRCDNSWDKPRRTVAASGPREVKIGAVIPSRYSPPQLAPLCRVLQGDGVYTIVQDSEEFGHNIHRMWNDGVMRLREAGCTAVAILNDDIEMAPGTLALMEKMLRSNPTVAVVSPDGVLAQGWPARQGPKLPERTRLELVKPPSYTAGFAFLFDPNDPDIPEFNEALHLWEGDHQFFDEVRLNGRAISKVVGLVIVHEGSHSTYRMLNQTGKGPIFDGGFTVSKLEALAASGNAEAARLLEDVKASREWRKERLPPPSEPPWKRQMRLHNSTH